MGSDQSKERSAGGFPHSPSSFSYPPEGYAQPYPPPEQEPPVAHPYPGYSSYPSPPPAHSSSYGGSQPPQGYPVSGPGAGGQHGGPHKLYSRITDNYNSLEEVSNALARAGLESSNLIVGIDFTKSNEWTGKRSFQRRSLHHIGDYQNPYEQAISIIGRTLSSFDEDNLIPCFGFGDATTHDQDVFGFYPDEKPCRGFEDVLSRYRELVPHIRLSGPTSFAPIIEMATTIVEKSGGQYHVLLIIADGQVTRSTDLGAGQLSSQERRTYDAIVQASHYPLSIVLVGVGDGPWDTMKEFDDNIPSRVFDNFQFVNFSEIMSRNVSASKKETEFALSALMEVPLQYKATVELGLLGNPRGSSFGKVPLPPPGGTFISQSPVKSFFERSGFQESASSKHAYDSTPSTVPSAPSDSSASQDTPVCPICLINPRDMAFGCGHQTCRVCGQIVNNCPICRKPVELRIKLY